MPLYDFECPECACAFDDIVPCGVMTAPCPTCGKTAGKIYKQSPKQLLKIIPDYPGCRKQKAGYVHSHADRPATKVQGRGASFPAT